MNYRGSYRHLLRNSKSAMLAAIEIYNKPAFEYRDECFVILLLNAWELVLKALLSKNGQSIFYSKQRGTPYKTLSWSDAFTRSQKWFPKDLPPLPVRRNLDLLSTYRDNAVHFYNAKSFGSLIYALAQTSIVNYKDLLQSGFDVDLGKEISWQLLPLGLKPPVDPIEYIAQGTEDKKETGAAVRQFLTELAGATREVQDAGADTGRLLTVFTIKLESTKKIEKADVVVGVQKVQETSGPLVIERMRDPNTSHPLRQKEVVSAIEELHGQRFTSHTFQALMWQYKLKDDPRYCWQAAEGILTKYSRDVIAWIKRLSEQDVQTAVSNYKQYHQECRKADAKIRRT